MEDTRRYKSSGVWLAWLHLDDLISVILHARSALIPAISVMANWLTQQVLLCPSLSWWYLPFSLISLYLLLNSTITSEPEVKSSLSISPCHDHELTLGTVNTMYRNIPRLTVSHFQPGSSFVGCCCTQHSTFPQRQVKHWMECEPASCLPPDRFPPSTPPISLDHSLRVHLPVYLISACYCMFKLARSRPRSASLS